ncbi:MAG: DMT family transporter [Magnetococcales bacterium]|nr:DMT family transporter [Magnetococcales bacterium]
MAFLTVTCIWGSTPLAIQWSQAAAGYQFAVTARITVGALLFLLLIPWLRRKPAPAKRILVVAVISGCSLFAGMFCVYWGARFVPSGLISVLYGLGPMLTGLMATTWLKEPFTRTRMAGSLLGIGGLMVLFHQDGTLGEHALMGIGIILLSVIIYSAGNLAIKQWSHNISPLWVTAGSLWVACPLFLVSLWLSGTPWPTEISGKGVAAIFYLGLIANGFGFVCFYYLLSRVSATNATLVTLTAPVVALWIGAVFNQEPVHDGLAWGTLLILGGLGVFQWGIIPWPNHAAPEAMEQQS